MDIRSDSGLEVFPVDTEHKFAVSISSYPEQVMTPALDTLLYTRHCAGVLPHQHLQLQRDGQLRGGHQASGGARPRSGRQWPLLHY